MTCLRTVVVGPFGVPEFTRLATDLAMRGSCGLGDRGGLSNIASGMRTPETTKPPGGGFVHTPTNVGKVKHLKHPH